MGNGDNEIKRNKMRTEILNFLRNKEDAYEDSVLIHIIEIWCPELDDLAA